MKEQAEICTGCYSEAWKVVSHCGLIDIDSAMLRIAAIIQLVAASHGRGSLRRLHQIVARSKTSSECSSIINSVPVVALRDTWRQDVAAIFKCHRAMCGSTKCMATLGRQQHPAHHPRPAVLTPDEPLEPFELSRANASLASTSYEVLRHGRGVQNRTLIPGLHPARP